MRSVTNILLRTWFVIIQFLTVPPNFVFTRILHLTVERPHDFKIPHGTLIIANHQSKIDPFLISYHVGIKNWTSIVPIRYPVTPDYMNKHIMGFIICLFGGYNIGNTPLERLKKLVYTRELLRQKYSVVLFPEGKIVRDRDRVAEFQKGAHMLFNENYPLVFVRLTGLNRKHYLRFWKNKDKNIKLIYSKCYDETVDPKEKIEAMVSFFEKTV